MGRRFVLALVLSPLAALACSTDGACPSDLSQPCANGSTCEGASIGSFVCAKPFSCSCASERWQCTSAGNGDCQCAAFALGLTSGSPCNVPGLVCTRSSMESGCTSPGANDWTCDGTAFDCPPMCGPDGG